MVGVVFFDDGAWLHCGLTDGVNVIDSQPGRGVTMRPLPSKHAGIYWLPEDEGRAAWHTAWTRIGERFEICASFVCQCMGQRCLMPSALRRRLARGA